MPDAVLVLIIFLAVAGLLGTLFFLNRKKGVDEKQSAQILDLERRLTDLIISHQAGTSKTVSDQISSFTKETTEMKKQLEQVQETMRDISSFQEIFRTPKLRGEWGEANLAHILAEVFPKELCLQNYQFSSGVQVEFALKLPNKKILPIDAKFSSDNFEKMKESNKEEERAAFRKKLIQDIKFNVQEISSKYIVPSENTVDFALMFVPAEAIFYEIMFNLQKEEDMASYARSKKGVLCSPNTIYLTLRTIVDWFRDTQISRQTQEILKRLNKVQQDSEKLMDDFRKLGSHLRNATSAYDNSEKRLSLFSDKVEKLLEQEPKKLED